MTENQSSEQPHTTINQQAGDNSTQVGINYGIINVIRSVFSSSKQVVTFILTPTAVLALVALGYWVSVQPRQLQGDFNIAVSKFKETTNNSDVDVAESAGQLIFNFLDGEYELSSFQNVDVEYYDEIDPVVSREDAQDLMDKTNADIVIFGEVQVINNRAKFNPKFYVTEQFQFDVLSGRHELELPVNFELDELLEEDGVLNTDLVQRMAILTEFTKGLVYFAADDLELSAQAMDSAIGYVEQYGRFSGSEVIYLLASNNARLQMDYEQAQDYLDNAREINNNYGRAYIAQGNIFYDQLELYQAITTYQEALTLEGQDPDAYIVEKASLNIGNIYVYQFQETDRNPDALPEEKERLSQESLTYYQVVIDSFINLPRPEPRLQDMAAWAYYGSGIVYQVQGDIEKAAEYYQQALDLTKNYDLRERATRRLDDVQPGEVP